MAGIRAVYGAEQVAFSITTPSGSHMSDCISWIEITTKLGAFIARAKLDQNLVPDTVFAQHGWTVSDTEDGPNRNGDPLLTNMNQAISTEKCDPISGPLPLRCSWCKVREF